MKVALITLGCPKNLVDAEVMLGLIDEAGHRLVDDPRAADAVVINTCAFISSAVDESRRVIGECVALRNAGRVKWVIAAGCLPQRRDPAAERALAGVDGVVGCSHFLDIARALEGVAEGRAPRLVSTPTTVYDHRSPRVLATPRHLAYVKIAEGCDNRCSYCTVPSLRGALRSRPVDSVVAEVESLLELGVREVNLIAQDTTAYGTDIAPSARLPELLRRVSATGVPWIRTLYAHPARITDELVDAMASLRGVVPYLDVPVQHVSDRVLRAMGRTEVRGGVRAALERLRAAIPGVTLRSSVMAGFPGETEREFEELLAFVRTGAVDWLAVFEFSPEPGTPAASMPSGVPPQVASARARALVDAASRVAAARNARAVGSEVTVLVDSGGACAEGRTAGQAWEIDGRVLLRGSDGGPSPGAFVRARVTGVSGMDLRAATVAPAEPDRGPGRGEAGEPSSRSAGGETS
ncbi:MAG: 30S ribosomal protein S12 methylthiotransferase RimO [Candidatus Eisenbacteria bacterium]|nr:30S ribosomal protein S12 methylthiotransferase RimO [Candidatus Eisenbacteria bacterium]